MAGSGEAEETDDTGGIGGVGGSERVEESAEAANEAHEFEADLATLLRERDDLLDTTRRLQADFENYRKRMLREQTALVERATERLIEHLLPVLDSFELAVVNLQDPGADREKIRRGVDLVYAELLAVLEKAGLARIEAVGTAFDPNEHEAVLHDDDGDGDPVVGDVLRAGWRLQGRVLRPAMVKVVRRARGGRGAVAGGETIGTEQG